MDQNDSNFKNNPHQDVGTAEPTTSKPDTGAEAKETGGSQNPADTQAHREEIARLKMENAKLEQRLKEGETKKETATDAQVIQDMQRRMVVDDFFMENNLEVADKPEITKIMQETGVPVSTAYEILQGRKIQRQQQNGSEGMPSPVQPPAPDTAVNLEDLSPAELEKRAWEEADMIDRMNS